MAGNNETQAQHLTSLTVGIQGVLDNLQKIREETDITAEYIRDSIGKSLTDISTGTAAENAGVSTEKIRTTVSAIESLNLSYKSFLNTISKSKLDNSIGTPLAQIKKDAEKAAGSINELTSSVSKGKTVTDEQAKRYLELNSQLKSLKGQLKDAETQAYKTGEGFKATGTAAENAGGFVADFISKLSDKVKWLAAFQLITLVQNSLREVVTTIKDTEDSVIELQRVLNDDSLANSDISDALYDIAYRYGQTFENVQETAVLFAQTGKDWNEVLEATEATMLGLNTAELEVTTATQGLIAVISQFNLDAADLNEVVDKINITADNFPVTSEKIVAALQRAGGTAHNFNMTLDETIATITALSEATGRSGQNIGTALNSLIIFTSKAENLNLFAGLSDEMNEVVTKYQAGAGSILDVWKQLSLEIEKLSAAQADALYNSTAYEEFASEFEAEATEYAASIQDIYGTAGAYRRNYLTAILNDMGTVQDALENITDAEGYSLAENEKYMGTLTAQLNQLKIAAQELAVQFGESGFLEFAKLLVQASTGALKLTKDLGGLRTILAILVTYLAVLKKEAAFNRLKSLGDGVKSVGKSFSALVYTVRNLSTVVQTYNMALDGGIAKTEALEIATNGLYLTAGNLAAIIGIIVSAVSIATNKYNEWKEQQKELRAEAIKTGKTTAEEADKIFSLFDEYSKTRDISKRTELLDLLGYSEKDFDYLRSKYTDLDTAIKVLIDDKLTLLQVNAREAREAAEAAYKDIGDQDIISTATENVYGLYAILKDVAGIDISYAIDPLTGLVDIDFSAFEKAPKTVKEAEDKIADLNLAIKSLNKAMQDNPELKTYLEPFIDSFIKRKDVLQTFVEEVRIATENENLLSGTAEEVAKKIADMWKKASGEKDADGAVTSLTEIEEELENISTAMDELNGKMDSFQSAYKTLNNVVSKYNKSGILTADMMQTLLSLEPQYLEMLDIKNGKLALNEEAVNDLIDVNNDYMAQITALNIAEAYNTELKNAKAYANGELTLSEYKLKSATQSLNSDIYKLALQFVKGEVSSDDFKSGIARAAETAGVAKEIIDELTNSVYDYGTAASSVGQLGAFTNQFLTKEYVEAVTGKTVFDRGGFGKEEYYQKYLRGILDEYNKGLKDAGKPEWFPPDGATGKTAKDLFEQQLKDMKTEYQKWIKLLEGDLYLAQEKNAPTDVIVNIYKRMQQEIHDAANRYRDLRLDDNNEYIIELKKQWWKYQDEIDKLYQNDYNKFKEEQENKLSLLENHYNGLKSSMDDAGKSSNLQAQADTYRKIMESAHNEADRLRADGVEKNKDAIQSAIDDWWNAYKELQNINENILQDLFATFDDFISLADSLDVWDKLDFTKADILKDKLSAINKLFKDGTLTALEYKDALKDVGIAIYNAEMERLEKLSEDAEEQNKADVEAINRRIEEIEKLKDNSDDYYDGLIDNLKQVQEENKRVNDQLEYQNNRQKIITNLEQARARSGIEYRQKEMEYQQQLVDLDEEWRREQEELNLTDQMEQLEALKKQSAEDFELSIQQLNEQITQLNTGLEDTLDGLDKQAEELGKKIFDAINGGTKENLSEVGNQILMALDESQSPIKQKASVIGADISSSMFGTQLESAALASATNLFNVFKTSFINPMYSEISKLMANIMMPTSRDILNLGYGPLNPSRFQSNNSIVMYNNIPNTNAANSTIRGAQEILNINTNPSRF